MKKILLILLLLTVYACMRNFNEKEMIGTYSPLDYKNTYDTIQLNDHNIYRRKVYDINKKLVLDTKGIWSIDEDIIVFKSPFFLNLDRDLEKFPELLQDTISNGVGYIYLYNGTIKFCVGHASASLPNQNCYRKLK